MIDSTFDPYQNLLDTQQAMVNMAVLQNDVTQQILNLYKIMENLNARQDILHAQLQLVINAQKSPG